MTGEWIAFSSTLLAKIQAASLVAQDQSRGYSRSRERAWAAFHSLQVRELPSLWSGLFDDMIIQARDCTGTTTYVFSLSLSLSLSLPLPPLTMVTIYSYKVVMSCGYYNLLIET